MINFNLLFNRNTDTTLAYNSGDSGLYLAINVAISSAFYIGFSNYNNY
jgi:hypothetical protein